MTHQHPSNPDSDEPGFRKYRAELSAFFIQLIRPFTRWLYYLCRDWLLAEDLAQQAFMQAAAAWPKYKQDSQPEDFKRLLYSIGKRRWIDYVRGNNKNTGLVEEMVGDQESPYARPHYQLDIDKLVEQLPAHYREVVAMRLNGYSPQEIADTLRLSAAAVSRIWFNALRLYKEQMVMAEFEGGASLATVAAKFETSHAEIHKVWSESTQNRRQAVIARLLEQTYSMDTIAFRLDLLLSEIARLRSQIPADRKVEIVRALARQGWDSERIAHHLDVTDKQVRNWLTHVI